MVVVVVMMTIGTGLPINSLIVVTHIAIDSLTLAFVFLNTTVNTLTRNCCEITVSAGLTTSIFGMSDRMLAISPLLLFAVFYSHKDDAGDDDDDLDLSCCASCRRNDCYPHTPTLYVKLG